jgi:DNA modification methylase
VLSVALVGKNKGHPTVFPVELPSFFIRLLCPEEGLVLDPFSGSGTTGVAALLAGYNSVLIDNNPAYFDEAIERLKREGGLQKKQVSQFKQKKLL